MPTPKKQSLKEYLKEIQGITDWFDAQEDLDVEEALKKVKEAAALIKSAKGKFAEIENEFKEVKKKIEE
jgi:hypothetical protein